MTQQTYLDLVHFVHIHLWQKRTYTEEKYSQTVAGLVFQNTWKNEGDIPVLSQILIG